MYIDVGEGGVLLDVDVLGVPEKFELNIASEICKRRGWTQLSPCRLAPSPTRVDSARFTPLHTYSLLPTDMHVGRSTHSISRTT